MTPDRLAEIERLCAEHPRNPSATLHPLSPGAVITDLLAEVNRLQSAVFRLANNERDLAETDLVLEQQDREMERMKSELTEAVEQRDVYRERSQTMASRIAALEARQQELLATIVRVTNETPFPDEVKGWTEQRAKMVAEIGTLRSGLREACALLRTCRSGDAGPVITTSQIDVLLAVADGA